MLKRLFQISKWEVKRQFESTTPKTIILLLLVFGMVGGAVYATDVTPNDLNSNLYQVGVSEDSPYYPAVKQSDKLQAVPYNEDAFQRQNIEVLIKPSGYVKYHPTKRSLSAVTVLRKAVENYNLKHLKQAKNQSAAFPIITNIIQLDRTQTETLSTQQTTGNSQSPQDSEQSTNQQDSVKEIKRPSSISSPFPFQELLISFLFLVPLNFIIQTLSGSIMDERERNYSELLLETPANKSTLLLGKALPYILLSLTLLGGLTLYFGLGWKSLLAICSLTSLYFGLSIVLGLFARSYKDLTLLLVTGTIIVTTYVFMPVIFTGINKIAYISPLSVIVGELQGTTLELGKVLFATLPSLFTGFIMFGFATTLYKGELLYGSSTTTEKILKTIGSNVTNWKDPFPVVISLLPLVFIIELFILPTLIILPVKYALPIIIAYIAIVEEIIKSFPIFAGMETGKLSREKKTVILSGITGGLGFFVAEKAMAVLQKMGISNTSLNSLFFSGGFQFEGILGIGFVILWFGFHSMTTTISAYFGRKGWKSYAIGLTIATVLHLSYNLTVYYMATG